MMFFKALFVFAALLYFCEARPQDEPIIAGDDGFDEDLAAFSHAMASFFTEMTRTIDSVLWPMYQLMAMLETGEEQNMSDTDLHDEHLPNSEQIEDPVKIGENSEENEVSTHHEDDDFIVMPLGHEETLEHPVLPSPIL